MGIPVNTISPTAVLPKRGSEHAAGLDLYFDMGSQTKGILTPDGDPVSWHEGTEFTLERGCRTVMKTGITMAIPTGYYGQIAPRSGLAVKKGIMTMAGVIDSDYRGEIMVALYNSSGEDAVFKHGERIAQMLILPHASFECYSAVDLGETERGAGKFGSTGA